MIDNMDSWEVKLRELLAMPTETEVVEFKHAENSFVTDEMGKYFSALSNEANLRELGEAWLVFGVEDSTHNLVGSNYRYQGTKLPRIKHDISQHTTDHISFIDVRALTVDGKRVVMFKIPAAPRGIPVAFKGFYYGREHESLVGLSLDKIERIRSQERSIDWSAELCESATLDDLDPTAILRARDEYKRKNPTKTDEIDEWTDQVFLNKAKATRLGKITNTTILLLGKPESASYLTGGAISKITWILKNAEGENISHEHFTSPLIMAVDQVYKKIRRIKYQYMSGGSLFPEEVENYDDFTIREALNNCIAHQDYRMQSRITVIERDDSLEFSNAGTFLPPSIEAVVAENGPQRYYRNRMLVEAMDSFNMIETAGNGIPKLFAIQRRKFFPLPNYTFAGNQVTVQIAGKVLDMEYAKKIASLPDIGLVTMIFLDRVHRGRKITKAQADSLRKQGLIEGRYPNVYISQQVAEHTKDAQTYLKHKGVDGPMIETAISEMLRINGRVNPQEIRTYLRNRLSDSLNEHQRDKKIENVLQKMRKVGAIKFDRKTRQWFPVLSYKSRKG